MLYGLDALAHGAAAALIGFVPAVVLFWWLTRGIAGPRVQRPFVACCAAYGIAIAAAGTWAVNFERAGFADEAVAGALIGGALAGVVALLILLLFPRST